MQIFLIGMMGSGKTTIAKALCKYVQTKFIDLDEIIETNTNKKISEIFTTSGEVAFRQLETKVLKQLDTVDAIVATGGGVVEVKENRTFLQNHITIFLTGHEHVLWQRIQGDENRPLAQSKEVFQERYTRRQPLYVACAKYTIDTNDKSINDIVAEILFIIAKEEAS